MGLDKPEGSSRTDKKTSQSRWPNCLSLATTLERSASGEQDARYVLGGLRVDHDEGDAGCRPGPKLLNGHIAQRHRVVEPAAGIALDEDWRKRGSRCHGLIPFCRSAQGVIRG